MSEYESFEDLGKDIAAIVEKARSGDYSEALDESVGILQDFERTLFLEQRDPKGVPWKSLAYSTIKAKGHSTILVDTGKLYESLTTPSGTEDTVWMTGDTWLTFGTSLEYAHYHQDGVVIDGVMVLARRTHVGCDQKTADNIGLKLGEAVAKHIGGSI